MTTQQDSPANAWFFDTRIPGDEAAFADRKHPKIQQMEHALLTELRPKLQRYNASMYDTTEILKNQVKVVLAIAPTSEDKFSPDETVDEKRQRLSEQYLARKRERRLSL